MAGRTKNFVRYFFGKNNTITLEMKPQKDLGNELYFKELAVQAATSLIAECVAKCEIKTLYNRKPIYDEDYYMLNVKPNKNSTASAFIYKVAKKLLTDGEALILFINDQYLMADDFHRTKYALYPDTFDNITIGDYTLSRKYTANEVAFFETDNDELTSLIDGMYVSYGEALAYAFDSYKHSNSEKYKIKINTTEKGGNSWKEKLTQLQNNYLKPFFNSNRAAVPEFEGQEITSFENRSKVSSSADIRDLKKDIFETVFHVYKIPIAIANGSVTNVDEISDQLITLAVTPITNILKQGLTHFLYGFEGWKKGYKIDIDVSKIKYMNILKSAPNSEKMIQNGVMCIDEVRDHLDMEILDTEFSRMHFMTKNASEIQNFLDEYIGGKEDGHE